MPNFVILIGGPGKYMGCDKAHDQTWKNYFVPIQLAGRENLYALKKSERIYWLVYEPAYINRWDDDSIITAEEKKLDDGYWLHSIRKKAADEIINKGASNYLSRIKNTANSLGINYKGISTPGEFWSFLGSLPKQSISRVWYSGHASGQGLMLALIHATGCSAAASPSDMIFVSDIQKNSSLADRFEKPAMVTSKFYGCFTSNFAQEWTRVFSAPAEGAINKVDFGVVDRPSSIRNVMTRIEQTNTSYGSPDWKSYK